MFLVNLWLGLKEDNMNRITTLYYNTLMSVLKLVAGDRELTTWTFHKGSLRILGNDWINRNPRMTFFRFMWTVVYPISYVFLFAISVVLPAKCAVEMDKSDVIDFIRATNGFIVAFTFGAAGVKGIMFKVQRAEILRLMDLVDGLGELGDAGRPIRDRTILNSTLYMALLGICPASWTIYFLFFQGGLVPYAADYPWEDTEFPGYQISFGIDFLAATYCAVVHSVYDTMFPVAVGGICGHVASLRRDLSKLGTGEYGAGEGQVLAECYRKHVAILRVVHQMNLCFRTVFLVQAGYTVLHACIIIYQVMQVSDIFLAIMNTAPMLSSAYFQLLLFCYYGQLLTANFEGLKWSLYDNEWYQSSLETKKHLAMMTLAANRPVKLDSYGITTAAHPTYLSSLQDSISYYLILKTVTTG